MFLYCFIKLSYCKITLKTKKQKYNFSKHNHLGIFAQKKIYVEKYGLLLKLKINVYQ